MSEGVIVALIGFAGAVLGAAIAGFATVAAAGIKGKGESHSSISCGIVGLLASLGAAGGLILGAFFGVLLVQKTTGVSEPTVPIPTQAMSLPTTNYSPETSGLHICGESAFNENLQTTNPLFLPPEYLSGWISSDPSTIVLPDGTVKVFETPYVLIVEDLPFVQVEGVQRQAGKANTWGCWYSTNLSTFIAEDAKTDFCKKKAGGNVAVMYRVSSSGFEELATTATISCP